MAACCSPCFLAPEKVTTPKWSQAPFSCLQQVAGLWRVQWAWSGWSTHGNRLTLPVKLHSDMHVATLKHPHHPGTHVQLYSWDPAWGWRGPGPHWGQDGPPFSIWLYLWGLWAFAPSQWQPFSSCPKIAFIDCFLWAWNFSPLTFKTY